MNKFDGNSVSVSRNYIKIAFLPKTVSLTDVKSSFAIGLRKNGVG